MLVQLQLEAETRADQTATLDKLIAFWSAYIVDFKHNTSAIQTTDSVSAEPSTQDDVILVSDSSLHTTSHPSHSTVAARDPPTDHGQASVAGTKASGGRCASS
uniref:Uncharacterized protein n=1 Tax=Plectus sambesii TaxID=2011161 RepID=A0A914VAW8_9BILA